MTDTNNGQNGSDVYKRQGMCLASIARNEFDTKEKQIPATIAIVVCGLVAACSLAFIIVGSCIPDTFPWFSLSYLGH